MDFDKLYFLLVLPPLLLLSLWARWRTRSAFKKYSQVRTMRGLTGSQAAQDLLWSANVHDVEIVPTRGVLTDHYDPVSKTLALSEAVYASDSVAAVGVACHEAGHAIQHAQAYKRLWLHSMLVPTASLGSAVGYAVMFGGLLSQSMNLVLASAVLFSAVLVFQAITLSVELDASARAKRLALHNGIVLAQEREGMDKVLNAAALAYVAPWSPS